MDIYTATEQAYKNGYANAIRNFQDKVAMHFGTYTNKDMVKVSDVFKLMNQIAEKMLEE